MAIDKSLLDDIVPSDSAVSRLKKRPRRIKPWESDILLHDVSTNSVPGNDSVGSPSSLVPTLSVPNTEPMLHTGPVLGTEAVSTERLTSHFNQAVNKALSDPIQNMATKSALSIGSVLHTGFGTATTLVVGPGTDPPTKLDVGAESGAYTKAEKRISGLGRNYHNTKYGLSADEDVRHQSVFSTDMESSHQSGAIPNNRRSTSVPPSSAKRVQPYVISESENFTRVPHAVTEALQREEFSSRQFRILVTILRETIGWGREYAELSAKDFAKKTGIASSHIFTTLRDLEDDGAIIRRTWGRNAKNSYALNRGFFAKYTTKRGPDGGSPNSTDPVLDTEGELTTVSISKLTPDPVVSTHHQSGAITSQINCENSNTIPIGKKGSKKLKNSLRDIPEILRGFIENTRPTAKLESERECAFALLTEYSAEQIASAVDYLRQNGVLGTGEPVHSPFKYLMSAAEQVMALVSKVQKNCAQNIPIVPPQTSEALVAYEEAVPLFENRLSEDAKQKYIANYVELELSHGFLPPQGVLRKLAAVRWYIEQQSTCESVLKVSGAQ